MSAWYHPLSQTSHRIVGLYWISVSAAYCILNNCLLCCNWGRFFGVWSGEGEVEDTFEEAGGKSDGSMGGGRGKGTVMGVESVWPDGAPGDRR